MRYGQGIGIRKITVPKQTLLEILEKNKTAHHEVFDTAMVKFREEAVIQLDQLIDTLKAGKTPRSLVIPLPIPEEHTRDYERAIRMLNLDTAEEIELDEDAYMQLVEDEWGWRQTFISNTVGYAMAGNGLSANASAYVAGKLDNGSDDD